MQTPGAKCEEHAGHGPDEKENLIHTKNNTVLIFNDYTLNIVNLRRAHRTPIGRRPVVIEHLLAVDLEGPVPVGRNLVRWQPRLRWKGAVEPVPAWFARSPARKLFDVSARRMRRSMHIAGV